MIYLAIIKIPFIDNFYDLSSYFPITEYMLQVKNFFFFFKDIFQNLR
jgi:hypothetical protein